MGARRVRGRAAHGAVRKNYNARTKLKIKPIKNAPNISSSRNKEQLFVRGDRTSQKCMWTKIKSGKGFI